MKEDYFNKEDYNDTGAAAPVSCDISSIGEIYKSD